MGRKTSNRNCSLSSSLSFVHLFILETTQGQPTIKHGVRCRQRSLLSGSSQASDVRSDHDPTGLGNPPQGGREVWGSLGTSSFVDLEHISEMNDERR